MLAHHLRRLLASAGGGFADGADSGEDLIMAANVIIHRRDINSHQTADALRRQGGQRHHRFAAHRMADKGGAFDLMRVERIEQILRHRGVGHLWRPRRQTVVAHIDLQNIVVGDQVAGEDAQVVQAAKQTVDQHDRGVVVRILCRLRSAI
jgi:hypothetical protein